MLYYNGKNLSSVKLTLSPFYPSFLTVGLTFTRGAVVILPNQILMSVNVSFSKRFSNIILFS